jgi:hypothetical protein
LHFWKAYLKVTKNPSHFIGNAEVPEKKQFCAKSRTVRQIKPGVKLVLWLTVEHLKGLKTEYSFLNETAEMLFGYKVYFKTFVFEFAT